MLEQQLFLLGWISAEALMGGKGYESAPKPASLTIKREYYYPLSVMLGLAEPSERILLISELSSRDGYVPKFAERQAVDSGGAWRIKGVQAAKPFAFNLRAGQGGVEPDGDDLRTFLRFCSDHGFCRLLNQGTVPGKVTLRHFDPRKCPAAIQIEVTSPGSAPVMRVLKLDGQELTPQGWKASLVPMDDHFRPRPAGEVAGQAALDDFGRAMAVLMARQGQPGWVKRLKDWLVP